MGQVLRGGARATEAVRRAVQPRQGSVRAAARRERLSPTTVQKWRKRSTTADARMGPEEARSTVLAPEEEAIAVAFRGRTLLPLDDRLDGLQPAIPHLARSSLHRCPERRGISRLPEITGDKPRERRFASHPIGCFRVDLAEAQTGEGKLRLLAAIDRTGKFAFVRLLDGAGRMEAAQSLRGLIEAVPYQIHTVLTAKGAPFAPRKQGIRGSGHIFGRACRANRIERRLTEVDHPWTNGPVERMNRTLKDATVKRHHHGGRDRPRARLARFVDA
jgi:transposase-like protein